MKKKVNYYRITADKLLQELGRLNYDSCLICGSPMSCLHHFFPKSSSSALRYYQENLIPVCAKCHLGFHSNRCASFIGHTIKILGQDWFDDLEIKKQTKIKTNIGYYKEKIEELQNLKKLNWKTIQKTRDFFPESYSSVLRYYQENLTGRRKD